MNPTPSPKQTRTTEEIAHNFVKHNASNEVGLIEFSCESDKQIFITRLRELIDTERQRAEEAEKKLDNLSHALTVVFCQGCRDGHRFRDMSGGFCAKCLSNKLSDSQKRVEELEKEKSWLQLLIHYLESKITEDQLLTVTESESEHPEWWEYGCFCYECRTSA